MDESRTQAAATLHSNLSLLDNLLTAILSTAAFQSLPTLVISRLICIIVSRISGNRMSWDIKLMTSVDLDKAPATRAMPSTDPMRPLSRCPEANTVRHADNPRTYWLAVVFAWKPS